MNRNKEHMRQQLLIFFFLCSAITGNAAGFLHTQGQDMVDENGQKILLRGVGLGNWMLPEGYMWHFGRDADRPRRIEKLVRDLIGPEQGAAFWSEYRNHYIAQADIQRIAELGFNSVRPALDARLFLSETEPPAYLEEGFRLLDNLVGWCRESGIYVIIDMHAAPGGQTGQNIDDSLDDQPRLFSEPRNQDRLVDLWVKIAERYKNEAAVAAYDLLNEPLPERTGAEAKYKSQLEPLYQRITKAIRAVDKRHAVTIEGADWANDWSAFSKPFDDNMFYQFHYYCWDQPANLKSISRYLSLRDRLQRPIWAGETGERDDTIYWGTTQYFESQNVGWSFWPWKKMEARNAPYSIKAPPGWDEVVGYSRGMSKPSKEKAQSIFNQLLQNIRLENCQYCQDVVSALFRRVPGRVEGVNYGAEGQGKSFSVADFSRPAKYYRTSEPVPTELLSAGERRGPSEQAIRLNTREWAVYTINSPNARTCEATLKAKAESTNAVVEVSLNGTTRNVTINQEGWSEFQLGSLDFSGGANGLKVYVARGPVLIDWLNFQ